jgi:hypothetical protein
MAPGYPNRIPSAPSRGASFNPAPTFQGGPALDWGSLGLAFVAGVPAFANDAALASEAAAVAAGRIAFSEFLAGLAPWLAAALLAYLLYELLHEGGKNSNAPAGYYSAWTQTACKDTLNSSPFHVWDPLTKFWTYSNTAPYGGGLNVNGHQQASGIVLPAAAPNWLRRMSRDHMPGSPAQYFFEEVYGRSQTTGTPWDTATPWFIPSTQPAPFPFPDEQPEKEWTAPQVDPFPIPIGVPQPTPLPIPIPALPHRVPNPDRSPTEQPEWGDDDDLFPMPGPYPSPWPQPWHPLPAPYPGPGPAPEPGTPRPPRPKPRPAPSPGPDADHTPRPRRPPRWRPSSQPAVETVAEVGTGNRGTSGGRTIHENKIPPRGQKERKKRVPGAIALAVAWIVNTSTEMNDFVSAIYSGLPWKLRRFKGRDGKWRDKDFGTLAKAIAIFTHFDQLNIGDSVKGLIANEVTDRLIGYGMRKQYSGLFEAARRAGVPEQIAPYLNPAARRSLTGTLGQTIK